jgi:hypothetical protein
LATTQANAARITEETQTEGSNHCIALLSFKRRIQFRGATPSRSMEGMSAAMVEQKWP